MNNFLSDQVMGLWKNEYSNRLNKYSKYNPSEHFHQIAKMCAPGLSYYYILNLNDFSLDFIHPNVEEIIGIKIEDATMDSLLSFALPQELEIIKRKEKVIYGFVESISDHKDLLNYKIVYTYKCRGKKNKLLTMMVQTTPISLSETGFMEHAFVIHSDITHLKNVTTDWVSFINLDGKESFLNIKAEHQRFDSELANLEKNSITKNLTKREKEIIKLLSQGLTAQAIAEELFISFNTVRTHRKNILAKTNCQNTTELIGKCLSEGLI